MTDNPDKAKEFYREFITADVEFIHQPIDYNSIFGIHVYGSEFKLTYRLRSNTIVFAPTSGLLTRVFIHSDDKSYAIVINSDTTTCNMSDISAIDKNQNSRIIAGERLGSIIIPDGMAYWDFYIVIASKHEYVNLLSCLRR